MNRKGLLLILLAAVMALPSLAQGRKNMRLNEVLVQADSMAPGCKAGWLELYNSSYSSNGIEKMFITTLHADEIFTEANKDVDRDVVLREAAAKRPGECYEIPRGDERRTKIAPRSHVVFIADGDSTAGTFHLPFVLEPGKDNYIALYDVNGELVDEVTVPATLPAGCSYAYKAEGRLPIAGIADAADWQVRDGKTKAMAITPGNYNTRDLNNNIEDFHIHDPHGFAIALLAMSVVFSALLLLYICFKLFGKTLSSPESEQKPATVAPLAQPQSAANGDAQDEAIAAIAMALYEHLNAHDTESGVLTFDRDTHTAWTSKSAMMRQLPERR